MNNIIENISKAILEYDNEKAKNLAEKSLMEGIDPIKVIDALTEAIRQVGDGFGRGELWLPDLIGAAAAMQAAMPVLQKEIRKTGKNRKHLGCVVIGTVFGDIHNIGKDMVATLLSANNFEVFDLGVNISAEQFAAACKEHDPKILAMSSLLTTTAKEQEKVINMLKKDKIKDTIKVMIGGGAITQNFSDYIGADGFAADATSAVGLAKDLLY